MQRAVLHSNAIKRLWTACEVTLDRPGSPTWSPVAQALSSLINWSLDERHAWRALAGSRWILVQSTGSIVHFRLAICQQAKQLICQRIVNNCLAWSTPYGKDLGESSINKPADRRHYYYY